MFRWRRTISIRDSWRKGEKLRRSGKMTQAKELLLKATESSSPLDRHYAYIKLIQLYQDMSIDGVDYTPEIVNICLQDIDLFPQFYEAWMVEYLHSIPTPYFPSFSVLAEIYEHAEKVEEAISLCELALGYGLSETRGEDYPEKLERLYKKRRTGKN